MSHTVTAPNPVPDHPAERQAPPQPEPVKLAPSDDIFGLSAFTLERASREKSAESGSSSEIVVAFKDLGLPPVRTRNLFLWGFLCPPCWLAGGLNLFFRFKWCPLPPQILDREPDIKAFWREACFWAWLCWSAWCLFVIVLCATAGALCGALIKPPPEDLGLSGPRY